MRRDSWIAMLFLGLLLAAGAVFIYGRVFSVENPGDYRIRTGNYRLEDGLFEEALDEFRMAIEADPDHPGAYFGMGTTFLQMNRLEESIEAFDRCLALDPEMAPAYADRGIARDRLGEYEKALADYRTALALDPELAKGPGWLWRFLHNISQKPPSILDRADYIEAELAKPEAERLLRLPEEDEKQRMYKID
jgi:tetratricopeptide (TPR) repeat protein